ncbi:MAG: hypothetical protein CL942_06130 [Desulfovibrio sp.]|nr:hypothetical protein [Desulfovibrio sp.]
MLMLYVFGYSSCLGEITIVHLGGNSRVMSFFIGLSAMELRILLVLLTFSKKKFTWELKG